MNRRCALSVFAFSFQLSAFSFNYVYAPPFLPQIELAEDGIDHIGAVGRDGVAVEREGFVEFGFCVNGADIDNDILLVVFFDLFVGSFFRPEADLVKDGAVEFFIDGALQIAGREALDEDGRIPFLQEL